MEIENFLAPKKNALVRLQGNEKNQKPMGKPALLKLKRGKPIKRKSIFLTDVSFARVKARTLKLIQQGISYLFSLKKYTFLEQAKVKTSINILV